MFYRRETFDDPCNLEYGGGHLQPASFSKQFLGHKLPPTLTLQQSTEHRQTPGTPPGEGPEEHSGVACLCLKQKQTNKTSHCLQRAGANPSDTMTVREPYNSQEQLLQPLGQSCLLFLCQIWHNKVVKVYLG